MHAVPVYGESGADNVVFSGKRCHRGLYRSKDGQVVNADINGSVNILRKYLIKRNGKDLPSDLVRALVNGPCLRLQPLHKPLSL